MEKIIQSTFANKTYTPYLTTIIINLNLKYDHFEAHTFINLTWPSTPFAQLTCLLQNGIMN